MSFTFLHAADLHLGSPLVRPKRSYATPDASEAWPKGSAACESTTLATDAVIAFVFTLVSLARSYLLRRVFERMVWSS